MSFNIAFKNKGNNKKSINLKPYLQKLTSLYLITMVLLQSVAGLFLFVPQAYASYNDSWYDTAWSYRKEITIDKTKVPHTDVTNTNQYLTDFPVLVSLTDDDLKASAGKVQKEDGSDILFTLPDKTLLNYEIESYNKTEGKLVAWVKVPQLYDANNSSNTIIYMYYGNSNATANTQANINGVWDSNFKAVYHLNETGSLHANDYKDSTSNAKNSTNTGNQPVAVAGKIGTGESFDGSKEIAVGNMGIAQNGTATMEGWFHFTQLAAGSGAKGLFTMIYLHSANDALFFYGTNDYFYNFSPKLNNWYHIAIRYSGTTSTARIYVNGQDSGGVYQQPGGHDILGMSNFYIGYEPNNNVYFKGTVDEFRVSNVVRSADWIKTEYNNQSDPSAFYTTGTEENLLPPVITSISASLPSGRYGLGATIPLTITFSKDVSGTVALSLNANPSHSCTVSVTNDSTVVCNYAIQPQDNTDKLSVNNITGSIRDSFGNSLANFTPQSNIDSTNTITIDTSSSLATPPKKPSTDFIKSILSSAIPSLSSIPPTIYQMAISLTKDFKDVSWQLFDLSKFNSVKQTKDTIYLKFRTKDGGVSDTIVYDNNIDNNHTGNNTPITIEDGDIVKTPNSPDIYVIKLINTKKYKRLILSPNVFNSYQHLKWENVKTISEEELSQYQTSNLVREAADTIIYTLTPNGDTGQRKPFDITQTYDPDSIYTINKVDRDSYKWEE